MMKAFLSVAAFNAVQATLYVVNNQNSDAAKNALWRIDETNNKFTKVAMLNTTRGEPSGNVFDAAVCGDNYYGIWADITSNAFGIVQVDLKSGKYNYVTSPQLYHAVSCNPHDKDTVLAVGSVPGNPHAVFSLRSFNISSGTDTQVAGLTTEKFYGYDASFSFNQAGTELYFGGGTDNGLPNDGSFSIMDTASGKILSGPFKYPINQLPYSFCPGTNPLQGMIMTGGDVSPEFFWAELTTEGDKVKVKKGANAQTYFNAGPMPVCDGTMYTYTNRNVPTAAINIVDAQTGKLKSSLQLPVADFPTDGYFLGGLVCE
mmetsp:Transcript_19018/g.37549  ORF Transcript_19018/g.37549 Transcript_19018/m.37549 type:complete len:316 (-) Transcript_19018:509-1456(-)|eukprot:CAMPEP_0175137970 /NCGR_PEP_ID=MMETSP0087-20121206/10093_1 /TAXON_ID=136419 /ORGANISM="Unknown Unknown, Strain D1" /LENGTH=315 /DNA_ID=CAMNT_0016420829 /DNA_START=60 /DNA_END=1007 /DNA_ORIENTATION=-